MSTPFTPIPGTLFGELYFEWRRYDTDAQAATEIASWSTGPLAEANTPRDLETLARSQPDDTLGALLELHQHCGSTLAGRALLALMAPKLVRITGSARIAHQHRDDTAFTERAAITITAFLDVIATYRPATSRGLAGALFLRTLGRITDTGTSVETVPVEHERLHVIRDLVTAPTGPGELDSLDTTAVTDLLDWATEAKVIKHRDRLLLQHAYLSDADVDLAVVADAHGLSACALRQRLSRAIRAIRHAVTTEAGVRALTETAVGERLTHRSSDAQIPRYVHRHRRAS